MMILQDVVFPHVDGRSSAESAAMLTNGQKMRLALILPTLAGGGMERMRVHLMQEWAGQGVDMDLVVSRFHGPLCAMVPDRVRIHEVARRHPALFPWGLYRYLRRHRPTHILSAANDINAMTLFLGRLVCPEVPVAVSVHSHLSMELAQARGIGLLKLHVVTRLLKSVLPQARGVVSVSRGVGDDLARRFPGLKQRLHVIYNPVLTPNVREQLTHPLATPPVPPGIPWIIYTGRLVQAKGLDVLLEAFRQIAGKTAAHLVLLGDGPLRPKLESMTWDQGLAGRVHFAGFQDNPLPWMREATLLALPSRREGLPNVLIEALACGTQVVATDCPGGSAEILEDGKYGQLVPVDNPAVLAEAMLRSLNGTFRIAPETLKARAEDFTVEKAAGEYMRVVKGEGGGMRPET
jgi:glycosyltransferase involved in cell wall biosynthesis